MGWLLRHNWLWTLLAFLLGAVITWFLLVRREQATLTPEQQSEAPAEQKAEELVGAGVAAARTTPAPAPRRPADPVEPFDQDKPEPPAKPAKPARKANRKPNTTKAEAKAGTAAKADTSAQPNAKASAAAKATAAKAAPPEKQAATQEPNPVQPFSRRMDVVRESPEPTLFDDAEPEQVEAQEDVVPAGRYGEGSADAVPHQGPPDGFTIKGNAQSMLFHTPDSPYYGRTKPEVWFRTEADAERAGFAKYVRKPRKSQR